MSSLRSEARRAAHSKRHRQEHRAAEEAIKEVVTGGLEFEYDDMACQLYAVTEYDASRLLSDTELEALQEYTQGQWSDGIGEGFEQSPQRGDFYISAWHGKQVITVRQSVA